MDKRSGRRGRPSHGFAKQREDMVDQFQKNYVSNISTSCETGDVYDSEIPSVFAADEVTSTSIEHPEVVMNGVDDGMWDSRDEIFFDPEDDGDGESDDGEELFDAESNVDYFYSLTGHYEAVQDIANPEEKEMYKGRVECVKILNLSDSI